MAKWSKQSLDGDSCRFIMQLILGDTRTWAAHNVALSIEPVYFSIGLSPPKGHFDLTIHWKFTRDNAFLPTNCIISVHLFIDKIWYIIPICEIVHLNYRQNMQETLTVSSATEEQLATIEEITASATSLSRMAEELQAYVSNFSI